MAKTTGAATREFIKSLAEACNNSTILYADMMHQEELFDFQDKIIEALLEANRHKLFTNSELLKFEHVFGKEKV